MTKEALKLALEALETPWNAPYVDGCDLALGKKVKAITAIKEALAQPERELVATWENKYGMKEWEVHALRAGWSLTPPQRTWVGLTEREQGAIMENLNAYGTNLYQFAQAIEAKLKAKNT